MTIAGAHSIFSAGVFNFIKKRDYALMRRIHHWRAPRWLRWTMVCASRAGDGWIWYALGFILLIFGGHWRYSAVCAGLLASGIGLAIYEIVKKRTRRTRPCLVEPNPWAGVLPPDQYSFPSGHTIASFAIATAVGLFYPFLMMVLLCCALLISVSRIMLGMHFLSDVVVGMLIGTFLGYAAYWLIR